MNQFTFLIRTDDATTLELKLGQYIPTPAIEAAASAAAAAQSAEQASASATAASQSATSATQEANNAAASAAAAAGSAAAASTSEQNAGASATTATQASSAADQSAQVASQSETGAGESATAAAASATAAGTSATDAAASATAAHAALEALGDPVSVEHGGTGSTTAEDALVALGGAPLAGPTFTGTVSAPTAEASDDSMRVATTAHVKSVFAAPPAIGSGTPNAGAFTSLSSTNGLTGPVVGGSPAGRPAGMVGEYRTATGTISYPDTLNEAPQNVLSMQLPAGEWDVQGVCKYSIDVNHSVPVLWLAVSRNSLGTDGIDSYLQATFLAGAGAETNISTPVKRFLLDAPTTIYLVTVCQPSNGGTATLDGLINARRV